MRGAKRLTLRILCALAAIALGACTENQAHRGARSGGSPAGESVLNYVILDFSAQNERCIDVLDKLTMRTYESESGPRIGVRVLNDALDTVERSEVTIPEGDYTIREILTMICESKQIVYYIYHPGVIAIDSASID